MKRLAALFLLCVVPAYAGRADDSLVAASKDAKAKRGKSTTRVITNADVKKSKGVLIDSKAAQGPLPPAEPGLIEQHEAAKKAGRERDAKIAALESLRADLEKQLLAIEQSYYEENDLQKRDGEIVRRFDAVSKQLDETLAQLDALRPAEPEATNAGPPATPTPDTPRDPS